jgi:hypothetical protein
LCCVIGRLLFVDLDIVGWRLFAQTPLRAGTKRYARMPSWPSQRSPAPAREASRSVMAAGGVSTSRHLRGTDRRQTR